MAPERPRRASISEVGPLRPELLMTPGPTLVPTEALAAQGGPSMYHRGPAFASLLEEVIEGLKYMVETDADVLVLTGSGTGALEAAMVNCFSPGDRLLVAVNGFFGERVRDIATAFGLDVVSLEYQWGRVVRADDVASALRTDPTICGVALQHSETSGGVINDVEAVAKAVAMVDPRPLLMVDAVSSVGATRIAMDEWGLDLVCGASQKSLAGSPGISFVAVGARAWDRHVTATCPRFYWDFDAHRKMQSLDSGPESPWTPAVSVLAGLAASLRIIRRMGRDALFELHELNARAVKAGILALGLELFGEDSQRAVVATAIRAPTGIGGNAIPDLLRSRYGVVIGPGMGDLRGQVFRIGHIGLTSSFDVVGTIAALEMTLGDLGMDVARGDGVAACMAVYSESGRWIR